LSRRCFIFRSNAVIFSCPTEICHEGQNIPYPRENVEHAPKLLAKNTWPDFSYFKIIVGDFIGRSLTYPCDTLDAFSGISNILDQSFPGGILHGLPELFFDVALLWQADYSTRDRAAQFAPQAMLHVELPTWSWARWQRVDLTAWDSANDHLFLSYLSQNRCTTFPIVEWYKIDRKTGQKTRILNSYKSYRNCIFNNESPVHAPTPNPWQRHKSQWEYENLQWEHEKKGSPDEFTHPLSGPNKLFRFPIPFPTNPRSIVTKDWKVWDTKIQGVVESRWLTLEAKKLSFNESSWLPLLTYQNTQVGVAKIHGKSLTLRDYPGAAACTQIEIKCIAISKGEYSEGHGQTIGVPVSFFDTREQQHIFLDGRNLYKFYNVMLIQEFEGFVERRGIGRIEASCWEAFEREKEEVLIG
jgi:hypothetical protein